MHPFCQGPQVYVKLQPGQGDTRYRSMYCLFHRRANQGREAIIQTANTPQCSRGRARSRPLRSLSGFLGCTEPYDLGQHRARCGKECVGEFSREQNWFLCALGRCMSSGTRGCSTQAALNYIDLQCLIRALMLPVQDLAVTV